ncbi:hypothetical protein D3C87_02130 [compost metagenome]
MKQLTFLFLLLSAVSVGCKKKGCTDPSATNYNSKATSDDGSCTYPDPVETGPYLIIKLHFDSVQPRLDNFGNPATIPSNHGAQSPAFYGMSAHYIEFAQSMYTQLGGGEILYHGAETTAGGSNAVNFNKAIIKGDNEVFMKIPLKNISPDTYEWVRMSLTYQNYSLNYRYNGVDYNGRLASFVGFNTYITNYKVWNQTVNINANKLQGYWAFENLGIVVQGQAPSTTVPNPLFATSPVPAGSCVVTGSFDTPFTITGNETQDITCTMSLSTNKSFEWYDVNGDNKYEPLLPNGNTNDYPTDMGLRGLKPIITQ